MGKLSKNDLQKLQVSSVMRNDKNFGKQFIFDGCDDTCWSSNEGSPQWIYLELKEERVVNGFSIQFQGGFVGKKCRVELNNGEKYCETFYPENVNSLQHFNLQKAVLSKEMKIVFEESCDFFGRIIVYSLDLF